MAGETKKKHRRLEAFEPCGAIAAMIDNETRGKGWGAKTRLYEDAIAALLSPKYPQLAERYARSAKHAERFSFEPCEAIAAMIETETHGRGWGARTRLFEDAIAALLGPKYPQLAERYSHHCQPAVSFSEPVRPATILLVEDNALLRAITECFLAKLGFVIEPAHNAEEGLRVFNPDTHDLVVTDNMMPGMSGGQMARVMKSKSPATPILMYTGSRPEDPSGVDVVLERSTRLSALKAAVEGLLAARRPGQPQAPPPPVAVPPAPPAGASV